MSRVRLGSDRDLMAIVVNLKEQRCLKKCLQTIDMEQTYATKILELDHRILKLYFRRLKEKVSRIRSNLTAEEILYLKKLDTEGRLKESYMPVTSNSSLKIAAAYRRLKLQPKSEEVAADPFKDSHVPETVETNHGDTDETRQDLEKPKKKSLSAGTKDSKRFPRIERKKNHVGRPLTSSLTQESSSACRQGKKRPSTAPLSTHALFSSHNGKEEFVGYPDHVREDTAGQFLRDCDIGSNLGENVYEEKRKERLQFELNKGKMLDRKTKDFLENLNRFVACQVSKVNTESPVDIRTAISGKSDPERNSKSLSLDLEPNKVSNDQYQEKLMTLWKDLSKCRYLRVADELLDLSGVVDLAKDQMKHFVNIHGFGFEFKS